MHFVNIDGSETESEFFGRFLLFCDIEPSRGCAKPVHVGVYAGMNERKKTNKKKTSTLCIPKTTANWYTQIYIWECYFCLSYWCYSGTAVAAAAADANAV